MAFIIGKKIEMETVWDDDGRMISVSRIFAEPNVITQIKTKEKDGYNALQLGFDASKNKLNKPMSGHLKDLGNFRHLHEFHIDNVADYKVGDKIDASVFSEIKKVRVTGIEKGRGFQGVVKRHGFKGGPKTHGNKDQQRMPGSIGSTGPQRVIKGQKMAGRMGNDTVTVKNLLVVAVDVENNVIKIRGAIPGNKRGIIYVESI